jgi:hypothetical protein
MSVSMLPVSLKVRAVDHVGVVVDAFSVDEDDCKIDEVVLG